MSEKSSSPSSSANLVISTVERARRTGGGGWLLVVLSGEGRAGREEGLERRVLLPLVDGGGRIWGRWW